ncbi:MAG: right-handed parallel beta-helix repeat-containing protein [Flavobacteriales bacterium]|nr:right-handed parallel beta-helix repeat-containing protein [Flavobacteriales bacterium]
MRKILLTLLILLPILGSATVYYVSPSGSDTNNGTSTGTPWKTISKVNAMGTGLHAGDQVLFLRGGIWREKLSVPNSGTSASKITFGAYGTGAEPIISGSVLVSSWTLHTGNIWKATVSSRVKQVYFNGALQTQARFPNSGFLRTDNASSTSTTDAALTQGSGYFTGATMVLRTTNWSWDTAFVSTHSGTTLTHTSTGNNLGTQNWGFFLRNKLALLDAAGEWYYDKPTSTLYVWCPGNAAPAGNTIEAAVTDFGIYFSYQRHDIIVQNIQFQHQIDASVRLSGTYNVEVGYCKMLDTQRAIYSTGATQNIHHNTIARTYQTAVYLLDNNSTFTFNTFDDICLWPGSGENNWGYFGLRCNGTGMTVSDNRFQNIGYIGMVVEANTLAERNVVRNPLMILNDGGGIAIDNANGMVLRKNIVMDAYGDTAGVAPQYTNDFPIAHGIYFGNISIKNTLVEYNTVANCSKSGIHVDHTMVSTGNQVRNNTMFNNGQYQMSISDYSNYNTPGATAPFCVNSFNTQYSGNIMYCLSKDQECMHQIHVYCANLVDFGTFSNNYYFNPYNELSIELHHQAAGTREFFSMERWAAQFAEDAGSMRSPLRQDIYTTASELSANLIVNGTFTTNVTGWSGYPYNAVITRDLTYLDAGALKAYLPNASQYATLSLRNPDQFNVQSAQWYRLKFSVQSNIHGNLNAGVKGVSQLVNANTIFDRDVPFDTQRRDMEWYFQSSMTDQALVQFIHSYTQPQYWMDNVQLHRVTVTPVLPADQHKIYVNDLATAQTFTLPGGCWNDINGVLQGATITVQPYMSKIVYRVTGTGCGSAQVDCAGTVGGTALPGTACNDNNPCTTNDTWNSNCQCTGTAVSISTALTPGGATSFCTGGNVVLSAATGTGYTYAWKKNGTAISGATSSSYTATQSGVYTAEISSSGCTSTTTGVSVTVSVAPSATITAGGSTTFCSGGSVALNANAGTGYTYAWKKDGTIISGATSATYTATQAGNYTVVVTSGGCGTTSSATAVTVTAAPSATITAGGATSFCTGGSVLLSANTGTGFSYVWKKNGTTISGATSTAYSATASGSYTVVVTSGSCATTSSATTVTVSAAPAATITAGSSTTFCSGGSVALNANTGTGYTYVWKRNGTAISGATAATYTATLAGSYTVVVSNGGCTTTSSATSVTLNAAPSSSITAGGSTSFCTGGNVLLSANTGTGLAYAWKRNGSTISGATSSTYNASLTGSYTVVVTSGGCSTTSSAISVSATAAPSASITAGGTTTFCSGTSVTLSANTGTGYTYLWKKDGATISGATGSTYAATASGAYTVVVSNGGCSTSSTSTTVTVKASPVVTCSSNTTNASVSVVASGGVAPYTYSWNTSPVQTTATATVSASSTYTATVTGSNGCTASCTTTITLQSLSCAGIRTEAQGTWGATATAYNTAGYMTNNFAAAFPSPNYLTIGCGSRLMRFTTGAAIITALPTYGTPALLPTGTSVNPTAPANTLVGQIVSLRLAVRFDELSPAFSTSDVLLKDMLVTSGTFAGWSVSQLLATAEQVIGGCSTAYPLSTLSTALTYVNNGYQGGNMNNGYLSCPGGQRVLWGSSETIDPVAGAAIFPNPFRETTTIQLFGLDQEQRLTVEIRSLSGALIDTPYDALPSSPDQQFEWQAAGRAAGVYVLIAVNGDRIVREKLIIE